MEDAEPHWSGLLRFVEPEERLRAKRNLESAKGRTKFLDRMCHRIEPDPSFSWEPPKGQRDAEALLRLLKDRGAPDRCCVFNSDCAEATETVLFQDLKEELTERLWYYGHGTFLSCVPGRLALFRTAWPHRQLIVQPKD